MKFEKTAFEIARENIRQIVAYMHGELKVPTSMIKIQLDAIISGLMIQEVIENESQQK